LKKLTLDIDYITDDFFADTRLLGIVVSAKNYRFCWQVNSVLGYNFRLDAELEIELKKKGRTYYFLYTTTTSRQIFYTSIFTITTTKASFCCLSFATWIFYGY